MGELAFLIAERVGLIILLAFILVNIRPFRRLLLDATPANLFKLALIFSAFAIISNLLGIEIDPDNHIMRETILWHVTPGYSVANVRILAVTVAGIVGGPGVGGLTGLVAGTHRMMQESWAADAWFYIVSSTLIGILSGMLYHKNRRHFVVMPPWQGFLISLMMESIQMAFVGLFSPTHLKLVNFIALPMIVISSTGTAFFLMILSLYFRQEVDTRAVQTRSVMKLAVKTLPAFRHGLQAESAKQVASLILEYTDFDAVGIGNNEKTLAFAGAGSDHHYHDMPKADVPRFAKQALQNRQTQLAYNAAQIGCHNDHCPLQAGMAIPLTLGSRVLGVLTLYFKENWQLTPIEIQTGEGLGEILATQIVLGEKERQAGLLRDAELKSLQAQISPHFFFNSINTIIAISRFDSEKARFLLRELSTFFQSNLLGANQSKIPLKQEEAHVKAYLNLEQTRFPDKYNVEFYSSVDDQVLVPPFAIQVLVENAIHHAFGNRKTGNIINIWITKSGKYLEIRVADNGEGIDQAVIGKLGKEKIASEHGSGTAMQNLNARLKGLYGDSAKMQIVTGKTGTSISLLIPYAQTRQDLNTEEASI